MIAQEYQRPLVLCDIDRTLIDSDLVAELALGALADVTSQSIETIIALRDNFIELHNPRGAIKFHPVRFIEYVVQQLYPTSQPQEQRVKKRELLRVYLDAQHFLTGIYAEVQPVLEVLKRTCTLGTFSEGVKIWQLYKLHCTKLVSHFPEQRIRYILPNKRTSDIIASLPMGAIVVDDNPAVIMLLHAAQQAGQAITPVWVNRASHQPISHEAAAPAVAGSVVQVKDFTELPDLIANL